MAHVVLRLPEVKAVTKLSRSSIYLRIAENKFPKPISLGSRSVGWLEHEVQQWLDDKVKTRDQRERGRTVSFEEQEVQQSLDTKVDVSCEGQ